MGSCPRTLGSVAGAICACLVASLVSESAQGQNFGYEAKPKVGSSEFNYSGPEPAPGLMRPSEAAPQTSDPGYLSSRSALNRTPYWRHGDYRTAQRGPSESRMKGYRNQSERVEPPMTVPGIPPGAAAEPFVNQMPGPGPIVDSRDGDAYMDESLEDDCQCRECPECHHCFCTCVRAWICDCWLLDCETWRNFYEFGGVQAFKGPVDLGVNGNFGFQKGVNWGAPFWNSMGIGYQLGGLIALSDLNGGSGIVNHHRDQYFVTGGLFRRARQGQGFQGGAVLDYLNDQFYVHMNLLQIRAEISYVLREHEVGFWSATHTRTDTQVAPAAFGVPTVTWQANDQFNFFYRRRFASGAVGRMWVGFTSHADVIFGSDATVPFSERWAIQASYNYLLLTSNTIVPGSIKESWNLGIALVWYPKHKTPNACFDPYHPLFSVADNGSLMIAER